MSQKTTNVSYNMGWLGLLGVIFVVAKIFAIGPIATWSWWLVLLPFYAGLAIMLIIVFGGAMIAGLVFGVACLVDAYQRRQRRLANVAREKARQAALNKKD